MALAKCPRATPQSPAVAILCEQNNLRRLFNKNILENVHVPIQVPFPNNWFSKCHEFQIASEDTIIRDEIVAVSSTHFNSLLIVLHTRALLE